MPQVGFICPDKEKVLFDECFKKCRLGKRCVSTPTLKAAAIQRPWTGLPSTTQLLSGTRYAFLKIKKDYYEDIQNLAWILLGNTAHKGLENADTDGNAEIAFKNNLMSGMADYHCPEEKILWDYKTSGSFKVNKALGLVSRKVDDPNGERYKTSGRGYKKGDIKQVTVWDKDESKADKWEWILQTNRYAIWLQESGKEVKEIKIEVIVRDGGLMSATTRGVMNNIEIIDIPILNKEYVLDFFERKRKMLLMAIACSWSPKCNDLETWGGRKCQGYCPVSEHCTQMLNEHKKYEEFIAIEPSVLV